MKEVKLTDKKTTTGSAVEVAKAYIGDLRYQAEKGYKYFSSVNQMVAFAALIELVDNRNDALSSEAREFANRQEAIVLETEILLHKIVSSIPVLDSTELLKESDTIMAELAKRMEQDSLRVDEVIKDNKSIMEGKK